MIKNVVYSCSSIMLQYVIVVMLLFFFGFSCIVPKSFISRNAKKHSMLKWASNISLYRGFLFVPKQMVLSYRGLSYSIKLKFYHGNVLKVKYKSKKFANKKMTGVYKIVSDTMLVFSILDEVFQRTYIMNLAIIVNDSCSVLYDTTNLHANNFIYFRADTLVKIDSNRWCLYIKQFGKCSHINFVPIKHRE